MLVCTARSAARQADRELLGKIHEFFGRIRNGSCPRCVCVLTHVDTVPEHLRAEAAEAVAADLGVAAEQIVAVCTQWGRLVNLDSVLPAIRGQLPEAERLKIARCIRQIRKEQDEDKLVRQILRWFASGRRLDDAVRGFRVQGLEVRVQGSGGKSSSWCSSCTELAWQLNCHARLSRIPGAAVQLSPQRGTPPPEP